MELSGFENKYFGPLRAHGYFVSIFGESDTPLSLIIDCSVYVTDSGEEGTSVLRHMPGDPTTEDGACIACSAFQGERREWKTGCVLCPFCLNYTQPWALRRKSFREVFTVVPGKPATLVRPASKVMARDRMTSEHMIESISNALKHAALYVISHSTLRDAGWNTEALLLQSIEETK